MKKIISALTLGAMIASAAFADVSINLNFRQRANLFANEEGTKTALFTDAYSGNGSDNLAISLAGDIVAFDMQLVTDQAATNKIRSKSFRGTVFLGPVELFGGLWADGKLNGAYRAKTDVDAGNVEGMDFEYKKLGSAYAGSPSLFVDNLVQPVQVTSAENYAVGATYKLGFDSGALNINAAYVSNEVSDELPDPSKVGTGKQLQAHSGTVLLDGRVDNIGQAEVVFKYGQVLNLDTAMVFGAYVQPTIAKGLILTVGGAASMIDGDLSDYSADLRARYQVIPKKLSITSFHNFSAIADAEKMTAKLNGKKNATTKGIANNGAVTDGKCGGSAISRDQIISNNLMVRYNVNDKLSVFGIVADMIGMGKNAGKELKNIDGKTGTDAIIQLRASAWAQFYADPNNSITVGFVYSAHDVTEAYVKTVKMVAIPVIFRVKM